jgi:hypothetical protein
LCLQTVRERFGKLSDGFIECAYRALQREKEKQNG